MKNNIFVLLLFLLFLSTPGYAHNSFAIEERAKDPTIANITNISVKEKDRVTEIRIDCDSPFTYAIDKSSDPHKAVVELNNVALGKFTNKIFIGNGIFVVEVIEIASTKIEGPQRLVRLDITLTVPAEIKPFLKENSLILSVSTVSDPEVKKEKEEEKPAAVTKATRSLRVPIGTFGGGITTNIEVQVKSLKEIRSSNVVLQKFDYSCGSAALGTILSYFNDPVDEKEIIDTILKTGDIQKIVERRGFSLLDLKRFAEKRGYRVEGFKSDLNSMADLNIPVLLPIIINNYKHFVVFLGIRGNRVYLADPSAGITTMPLYQFEAVWFLNVFLFITKGESPSPGIAQIDTSYMDDVWNNIQFAPIFTSHDPRRF